MPPKAKAKTAAAKAKAKAAKTKAPAKPKAVDLGLSTKLAGLSSVDASIVPSEGAGVGDGLPAGCASSPRELKRSPTEEQADRAIELKLLAMYSKSAVEGAVNAAGERIRKVVCDKVRENRPQRKKLTAPFWAEIITDFKLSASSFLEQLDDPEDQRVREELLEKIGIAHADNPAARTVEPLERYLAHVSDLSYTELYGLVRISVEQPKITKAASHRMLLALLKACGKEQVWLKFPKFWQVMSDKFDCVLMEQYEADVAKSVPAANFFRAFKAVLAGWFSAEETEQTPGGIELRAEP